VLVLDDMISTAGTLEPLLIAVQKKYGYDAAYAGFTHGLLTDQAKERLLNLHKNYKLKKVIITDTVTQPPELLRELPFLEVKSLVPYLAKAINRIHYGTSLSEEFTKSLQKKP